LSQFVRQAWCQSIDLDAAFQVRGQLACRLLETALPKGVVDAVYT
jgi:hypothetical protein